MNRVVRVRLAGPQAQLGSVPAADVARLLLGVERAVARASGAVLRRRVKSTGRWGRLIEDAVRFRLVGIEAGSVVGVLELPAVERGGDQLEFDVTTLGESALIAALRTAAGDEEDVDVARAFVKLTEELSVGTRYSAVTFETDIPGAPRRVIVDQAARARLERIVRAGPDRRADTLVGALVEADFESHTARLRAADGQSVAVSFDEDQADDIKQTLRGRAQLIGEVTYDPLTSHAVKVEVRAIARAEQMGMQLETDDFWTDVTVDQLWQQRGTDPVTDPAVLVADDLTDEEAEELFAALGS